jgi:hypothetical protein
MTTGPDTPDTPAEQAWEAWYAEPHWPGWPDGDEIPEYPEVEHLAFLAGWDAAGYARLAEDASYQAEAAERRAQRQGRRHDIAEETASALRHLDRADAVEAKGLSRLSEALREGLTPEQRRIVLWDLGQP